jgi:hypothetical protein
MQKMFVADVEPPDSVGGPPEYYYRVDWEEAAAVQFWGPFEKSIDHRQNIRGKGLRNRRLFLSNNEI